MSTSRDSEIVKYKLVNPTATLQSIGQIYGITRERVRQILNEQGVSTHRLKKNYGTCKCGKLIPHARDKFCSRECFRKSFYVQIKCNNCGIMFPRTLKRILKCTPERGYTYGNFYCSRQCSGAYLKGKPRGMLQYLLKRCTTCSRFHPNRGRAEYKAPA